MLQSMRRHSQSFVIYILFGMLIVVFVFMFGMPTTDSCNPQTVAIIAEQGDFEINEEMLRSSVMRAHPETLRTGDDEFRLAQRQVLYNMLAVLLVSEEAQEAGLRVSDEDVRQYLVDWERGNPDAHLYIRGGHFERKAYDSFLDYYGVPVATYERYKRHELLARNYFTMLEASVVVSDGEARTAFQQRADSTNLLFAKLDPSHVEHLISAPAEADVTAFLAEHMDEVKTYFATQEADYKKPATVHLKEIIVQKREKMMREVGSDTDKTKAPEERFAALDTAVVKGSMDFTEAANKYNEALVYRENGGDRGVEQLDNISKQHRDAIEGKKAGDVVTFETDLTYNVIRIEERTDAVETALDTVQKEIAAILLTQKRSAEKLEVLAASVREKAAGGMELQAAIEEVLYAGMTEPVAPEDVAVPADGTLPGAEPTAVVAAPVKPAAAPAGPWVPLGERVTTEETGPFNLSMGFGSKWSDIPRIGDSPELAHALDSLGDAGSVAPKAYAVNESLVVVVLKEQVTGSDEEYAEQRDAILNGLHAGKARALLGDWDSVIKLRHPEPMLQAYGPWLQDLFTQAQQTGRFSINKEFLAAGPAELAAN